MIFTFTTLCLSKQTLQRQVWALTPLPALIHSAPVRYIVYVIWSGFNIIYYLLFLSPYYYTVSPSEEGTPMPLSHGQHIVPLTWDNMTCHNVWYLPVRGSQVWAGDNHSPLQRHIDLLFCQVYFSILPPLLSWSQLPPVRWRGSRVFCLSEGPTFFAGILSILCWVFCWLSLTLSLHRTPRTLTRIKL